MVHTAPDYSSKHKQVISFGDVNTNELAARLGSIDTFDRRGTVVWIDDFESGTKKWNYTTGGTGAAVSFSTDTARSGKQSLKLTTGDSIDDYAGIYKQFQRPFLKRIGAEISTTIHDDTKYIYIWLSSQFNGKNHQASIVLDENDSKIYYKGADSTYYVLDSDYGFINNIYTFYTLKLVVDFEVKEYVRFKIGGKEYDMSGISFPIYSGGSTWYLQYEISHTTNVNASRSIYLDDFILTQDEP